MLGQSGGCVSVLKLDNGKVLYRTPAHSGQKVTVMQAYPENGCLLTSGIFQCTFMAFLCLSVLS